MSLYDWLLVPYTLWPIDLAGAAEYFIGDVRVGRPLNPDFAFLIELLGPPPRTETQTQIEAFEHRVAKGNYDSMIRCPEKFAALEKVLGYDRRLADAWARLKRTFKTEEYAHNGVIRRRMSEERNFRAGWKFRWAGAYVFEKMHKDPGTDESWIKRRLRLLRGFGGNAA